MNDHAPPAAPAAPLRCAGCRYDLTGLSDDALCPECGVAISLSHWRGMSPRRVRRLRRGLRVIVLSVATRHAAMMLILPAVFAHLSYRTDLLSWVAMLLGLLTPVIAEWGALLAITSQQGFGGLSNHRIGVRVVRGSILAQPAIVILSLAVLYLMGAQRWTDLWVDRWTGVALLAARFAQLCSAMFLFAGLARRTGKAELAGWLYASPFLIYAVMLVGALAAPLLSLVVSSIIHIAMLFAAHSAMPNHDAAERAA